MEKLEINIPFEGFYESVYSSMMDFCLETESEHLFEQENIPNTEESDFWNILDDHANYSDMRKVIVNSFVDQFGALSDIILNFDAMTSPKEYNFETDRVFCTIPESEVLKMFKKSKEDDHATLAEVLKDRHSSYDGFISFYSNDLESWLEKPVIDWDSNELCSLLIAYLGLSDISDLREDLYYAVSDSVCGNGELENCIDWEKVEHDIEALRHKDGEYFPPRCDSTKELPL